jgi:hypothetical protein
MHGFELNTAQPSLIVMDAPDKEDSKPFVDIAKLLLDAGLNVPVVLNQIQFWGFCYHRLRAIKLTYPH